MTLTERLKEAEDAFHDLTIGRSVVEVVDQNGERIRYGQARKGDLLQYIADLKRQIEGRANAPMEFWGR